MESGACRLLSTVLTTRRLDGLVHPRYKQHVAGRALIHHLRYRQLSVVLSFALVSRLFVYTAVYQCDVIVFRVSTSHFSEHLLLLFAVVQSEYLVNFPTILPVIH